MRLGKTVKELYPGCIAHLKLQRSIVRKSLHRIRKGADVSCRHEQAFDTMADEMPTAWNIGYDERAAAGSSLQH
jgi:hypothetical protein